MRKLFACLFLAGAAAWGQSEIFVNIGRNHFIDFGRGLTWGASGAGGTYNAYIFSPQSVDSGICVIAENLSGNTQTVSIDVYHTSDPAQKNFLSGLSVKWYKDVGNTYYPFIAAGQSTMIWTPLHGAARAAVFVNVPSAAVPGDLANLYAVETAADCTQPGQRTQVPLTFDVGTGVTRIKTGVANMIDRIAHVSMAAGAVLDFDLISGHGTLCAVARKTLLGPLRQQTNLLRDFTIGPLGIYAPPGDDICVSNLNGTTNAAGVILYTESRF